MDATQSRRTKEKMIQKYCQSKEHRKNEQQIKLKSLKQTEKKKLRNHSFEGEPGPKPKS